MQVNIKISKVTKHDFEKSKITAVTIGGDHDHRSSFYVNFFDVVSLELSDYHGLRYRNIFLLKQRS